MHEFKAIDFDILLPVLLLIGAGVWLRRKFLVDLATLSKLNIYLFVPGFVFHKVSTSSLPWSRMGGVVLVTVTQVAVLGLIVWGIGRILRVNRKTLAAVAIAVMFYNSGNYGLPLAELAYPGRDALGASAKDGGAVQAFVVMTQNVLMFTVGLAIAAGAHSRRIGEIAVKILRLPVLYCLVGALTTRYLINGDATKLPIFIGKPIEYLASGLVPIALVTLGAQLAVNPRWPRWRPVSLVLVLRLLVGPVQMMGVLWMFHLSGFKAVDLWPWPAELLILTASVPTAVNTLLLTIELDGDADLAADCVFWTTILSCVTIAGWLVILRAWF